MNRRYLLRLSLAVPIAGLVGVLQPLPAVGARSGAVVLPAGLPRKPPPQLPPRVVAIDPGHGGRDPGAVGAQGTREKDVTLDIAKAMALDIARRHSVTTVLTRETDLFLPLAERVAAGREAKADLFVSIHADSAPNREARGLSAYTLSEDATDEFARALAKQENLADGVYAEEMSQVDASTAAILADMAAWHTRTASLRARNRIVEGAGQELRLLDHPTRSANFAVLKAPDVPSVLIETGFLSNGDDEQILRDAAARQRIAEVLSRQLDLLMTSAPFS